MLLRILTQTTQHLPRARFSHPIIPTRTRAPPEGQALRGRRTHHTSPPNSTRMAAETDAAVANTSGITAASLKSTLQSKLSAEYVEIVDMSGGCGQAYAATIVSAQFEKKTALARHRLVNAALREEIKAIHAWTPRCFTPEQWRAEQEREREREREREAQTESGLGGG
ncbi:hypothetical protein GJ744_003957 [Endocarpon pusillum]|uniref:BolA-like protein n=1 Tax=Endocarpon pusillum TaxID=364733 RepID=A0A8H7E1T9_9EURO|nr:hypothetical protein GJ744_003957 [Endocarpon pusillum]